MKHTNESGRSMVEMLGVIGVITVMTFGALSGIGYGRNLYWANATATEVENIARNIKDIFSWHGNYGSLTSIDLCKEEVFSKCDSNNNGVTLWGGEITVSAPDTDSFKIDVDMGDQGKTLCGLMQNMSWTYIDPDSVKENTCDNGGTMTFKPIDP